MSKKQRHRCRSFRQHPSGLQKIYEGLTEAYKTLCLDDSPGQLVATQTSGHLATVITHPPISLASDLYVSFARAVDNLLHTELLQLRASHSMNGLHSTDCAKRPATPTLQNKETWFYGLKSIQKLNSTLIAWTGDNPGRTTDKPDNKKCGQINCRRAEVVKFGREPGSGRSNEARSSAAFCSKVQPIREYSGRKVGNSCAFWSSIWSCLLHKQSSVEEMSDRAVELTNKPFAVQLSNVYLSILALFCFKLFVKISLNLLTYFYIVRGNRKEAARISAEFYDYGQQHSEYLEKSF
ncbi:hypothetical protein CCH79_00005539 [Gambusia affinis]|uniref:Uncharacterized protein n=1 Tax=Gambusia affinis TaxID=33528 RepID=A0A315V7S0_GAMAF|nr:hypothetical protein CCH79_00005539 [Gambusia affinis]